MVLELRLIDMKARLQDYKKLRTKTDRVKDRTEGECTTGTGGYKHLRVEADPNAEEPMGGGGP